MWINELTANTKSVESTMGSQRSSKWTMSQTFLVCLYYTDRGLQVNHNSLAVVLDHSGLRTAARGFHGEDPRVRRPTLPPLIGLDGEPAIRVVPAHVDPQRLRPFFHDRRDEQVAAPEVLVAELHGFEVAGVVEPQRAQGREAGVARFTRQGVIVGEQSVAQLEVLPANRLDLGVVELGRFRSLVVLHRTRFAPVPAPGQPELPGAPVRAEQGTKRGELEPPRVELTRELLRRVKPAGVGAPEWSEAERMVQPHRHLR